MGLFDRFVSKTPAPQPAAPAQPLAASTPEPAVEKTSAAGGVLPRLAAARDSLKAKDLPAAMAVYEEVLAGAGDRADVLVTISADLGTNGYVKELIELLAPRYDAHRHGAAAGINLLQAYLATRHAEAAQHLLDLLFSLQRPELEARLVGFSNAVAELFVSETEIEVAAVAMPENKISLVSISRPIWSYGLESLAAQLLPDKEGRLRKVAFAQCALLDLAGTGKAAAAEDPLARFSRGFPLWLAETFYFSAGYDPVAAIGLSGQQRYAQFPMEWVPENIRQLNESREGGFDYVVTSALRHRNADYEFVLRIWEVKKFRELKALTARWTPSNADEMLAQLHQQLRTYMEWTALPAGRGLAYAVPAAPLQHIQALGVCLTHFLAEKGVLAAHEVPPGTAELRQAVEANPDDPRAQLTLVASLIRFKAQGVPLEPESLQHAAAWLASERAQAAGVSALAASLT